MEPYSDWSVLSRAQQEGKIKEYAREILAVVARHDMPTKILAHPDDIETIKKDLMSIQLGNEDADKTYQAILEQIEWVGEGNQVKMFTKSTEEEMKIEMIISNYINTWVDSVDLARIAAQERVPLIFLQHRDILIQLWCAWMAQKLKTNSNIIVPGSMY